MRPHAHKQHPERVHRWAAVRPVHKQRQQQQRAPTRLAGLHSGEPCSGVPPASWMPARNHCCYCSVNAYRRHRISSQVSTTALPWPQLPSAGRGKAESGEGIRSVCFRHSPALPTRIPAAHVQGKTWQLCRRCGGSGTVLQPPRLRGLASHTLTHPSPPSPHAPAACSPSCPPTPTWHHQHTCAACHSTHRHTRTAANMGSCLPCLSGLDSGELCTRASFSRWGQLALHLRIHMSSWK